MTTNVTAAMQQAVDQLSVADFGIPASAIWREISQHFYAQDNGNVLIGMSRQQVVNHVYATQRRHYGGDIHGIVEMPPLSLIQASRCHFSSSTISPPPLMSRADQDE